MPRPIRGLHSLLIDVLDREGSVAFYRDLLGLRVLDEIDDGHVLVLALGDTVLVVHAATREELGGREPGGGTTLFLQVDDPAEWATRLREAGVEATGPTDEPWGTTVMTADPDGRPVGLIRPPG